ncbi:MAG: alpha-amylase family glycosyl hydrolase [Bacteroidota bacterium]
MITTLIGQLYPNAVNDVLGAIAQLTSKYGNGEEKAVGLTHEDCILITYGDSIWQEHEKPLVTLKRFADSYFSDVINTIHVLPCFPYSSDDGFSVMDYYQINPDLGDWQHIASLGEHFDLMFDAVVNHISQKSVWFAKFLKGEQPYSGFFIEADPSQDYSRVVRPRALPLLHAFEKQQSEVYVWTTFSRDQVDLNYANHKVFIQVLDVLLFYASKGAKYIRLDAIAFLWKQLGTSCIHLTETHLIIQAYRKVLEAVYPNIVLITETNVPHAENISYFGNGQNEAHMVYNFTLPPLLAYSVHKENVDVLTAWAKNLQLPDNACFFNFTASHDGVGVRPLQGIVSVEEIDFLAQKAEEHGGFVSYKDNGDGTKSPYELNCNYLNLLSHPSDPNHLKVQRFLLTQSVMLCMPGVPGIYYHSILGSQNDKKAAMASGIHRRINREKLHVEILQQALDAQASFRASVYHAYRNLLKVRISEKAFHPHGRAGYRQQGAVFMVERHFEGETILGVHNFASQAVRFKLPEVKMVNILQPLENSVELTKLPPFGFKWLKEGT